MNYLTASNRKYLPPSIDQRSLFGWIPTIFKINDDEIIQYAGLDAYVFLGFFKMSIKLLTFCLLFSAAVISPVRYYFTGNYDDDNPNSGDHYNGTAIISGSIRGAEPSKASISLSNVPFPMPPKSWVARCYSDFVNIRRNNCGLGTRTSTSCSSFHTCMPSSDDNNGFHRLAAELFLYISS